MHGGCVRKKMLIINMMQVVLESKIIFAKKAEKGLEKQTGRVRERKGARPAFRAVVRQPSGMPFETSSGCRGRYPNL